MSTYGLSGCHVTLSCLPGGWLLIWHMSFDVCCTCVCFVTCILLAVFASYMTSASVVSGSAPAVPKSTKTASSKASKLPRSWKRSNPDFRTIPFLSGVCSMSLRHCAGQLEDAKKMQHSSSAIHALGTIADHIMDCIFHEIMTCKRGQMTKRHSTLSLRDVMDGVKRLPDSLFHQLPSKIEEAVKNYRESNKKRAEKAADGDKTRRASVPLQEHAKLRVPVSRSKAFFSAKYGISIIPTCSVAWGAILQFVTDLLAKIVLESAAGCPRVNPAHIGAIRDHVELNKFMSRRCLVLYSGIPRARRVKFTSLPVKSAAYVKHVKESRD